MLYDPRYYTLDLIPEHRQRAIDNKISYLIDKYDITYPLDCVKLMDKILSQNNPIVKACPVYFGPYTEYEAEARYYLAHAAYILYYNIDRMRYPYITSSERRFNFTLAHEIAHIVLGHLKVINPTPKQKAQFELEANELAGRLLMPADDVIAKAFSFKCPEKVSAIFLVSERCLWRRLNNLKRLEILYPDRGYVYDFDTAEELFNLFDAMDTEAPFEETSADSHPFNFEEFLKILACPSCGDDNISSKANYCRNCGQSFNTAFI